MEPTTRRDFLKRSASAAASTGAAGGMVAAVAAQHPDADLLALERHLTEAEARFDREADDLSSDDFEARSEALSAMEVRLSEMPAFTAEGIAVKLSRIQAYFPGETAYDRINFRTAFEALRRLSGRAGS